MSTTIKPEAARIHLGLCVTYPEPAILERIGSDWDWIWLDGQHGLLAGQAHMLAMVRACNFIKVPAYLRVPANETSWISLALDTAADAIIVPQIDTVEAAEKVVRAAKFPPLGNRSYGGRRPIDLNGRGYAGEANSRTRVICQIESTEAVENAAAIAGVEGVDGLFFGPDDWALRQGLCLEPVDRNLLVPAISQVAEACIQAGKDCFAPSAGADSAAAIAALGVNYVVCGSDVGLLAQASRNTATTSRQAVAGILRENASHALAGIY